MRVIRFKPMLCAILLALSMGCALADGDVDEARRLYASGAILSLEHFVREAHKIRPGRVIEAALKYEDSHQRHVYEIVILDRYGRVWEVEFDAGTGKLIEHELEE